MAQLTRGELAKAAGVNRETIRYYEKHGLLPAPGRSDSNYCLFEESAIERLHFIKRAQAVGFSLGEIRELLEMRYAANAACGDVREIVEGKIEAIETQIRALEDMRAVLHELAAACPGGTAGLDECPILEHFEHAPSPFSLKAEPCCSD